MVNKNDIIEITIDGLGCNGEGIAHIGGYTVFIKNALPQERVRALVIFVKPTFAAAKLLEVITPSPCRVQPFCPVYGKCGGCSLQHITYSRQLQFKTELVADSFYKAAKLKAEPCAAVPSPQIRNYRNKMSLPVRGDKIGFFAENSHRIVEIDSCPIQFEGNGKLIAAFKKYVAQNGITGYNENDGSGEVRHLTARLVGGLLTVTAVVNGERYVNKLKPFARVLEQLYGGGYAYYININSARSNVILGSRSVFISGNRAPVNVDGLVTAVHPQSFFQVNDGVRRLIYEKAAQQISGGYVFEAYSGTGTLSAILSRQAKHVTAIEIESNATRNARQTLEANGINNVTVVCGDCAEQLPKLLDGKSDCFVVLDPPRAGCDERVINAVRGSGAQKIVYISCNPSTLARDCSRLQPVYAIAELTPFDMFPQTPNIETVAVLIRT